MHLCVLFVNQAYEFVVLLDGLHRLDIDRLSARTRAVDNALHLALLLDLNRDDETLTADGDQFVLRRAAFTQPSKMRLQRLLYHTFLLLDFAADACQLGRSFVVESPVRKNLVLKEAQQLGEISNPRGE